jgi:hypothetical protein
VRLSKSVQKTSIGKKVSSSVEIQIQNLDHLGIVAGLIDGNRSGGCQAARDIDDAVEESSWGKREGEGLP